MSRADGVGSRRSAPSWFSGSRAPAATWSQSRVVELTLALHRVFDSPTDALLWDTGHQSYVHKIVTGRADQFETLRQPGGLSGCRSRSESPHDLIGELARVDGVVRADGLAKAWERTGELGRRRLWR